MASRKPTASPERLSEPQLRAHVEAYSLYLRIQSHFDLDNLAPVLVDFRRSFTLDSHGTHAAADFAEGLSRFPEDIRFRRERCLCPIDVHDRPLTLEALDLSNVVEPENVDRIWQRADALRGLKRIPETPKTADELLTRRADHFPSPDLRYRIRPDVGRFDLTSTDSNRILEIDPESKRHLPLYCDLHGQSADLKSAEPDITSVHNPNENRVRCCRSGPRSASGATTTRSPISIPLAEVDAKRRLQREKFGAESCWLPGAIAVAKGNRESARSASRRRTDLRHRVTKEAIDFTMGKKGAIGPECDRLREGWSNGFVVTPASEMLDSRVSGDESEEVEVAAMWPSARSGRKSKKKSRGNGEGEMTV